MKAHGKVLREPNSGPGLLIIDGQQFRFAIEGVWRSEAPPKPGLNVEVELDRNLQVTGITAIHDSLIAPAQGEAVIASAKEKEVGLARKLITKLGVSVLIATVLLLVWFFLTK